MKNSLIFVLFFQGFLTAKFQLNAQSVPQEKTILGTPVTVNMRQAEAWDSLHPFSGDIKSHEQGDDEEEIITVDEPLGNNVVKNDINPVPHHQNLMGTTSPAPDLSFEGWYLTTTYPPDIRGAVGLNHIVQVTNEGVKVFNKTGAVLKTVTLKAFCPTASTSPLPPYDPHIVYDPNNNRYIFTCGGKLASTARSGIFVAVTKTDDPTGDWWLFFVDGTGNTSDLFDYPLLGFNQNWITITGNMFQGGTTFSGVKLVVIDRVAAYNGTASGAVSIFTDASSNLGSIAPCATIDPGQTTQYLVWNSTGNSGGYGYVKIGTITGSVNAPVYGTYTSVGVNQPWSNTAVLVPQKGGTVKLDMRDARIGNAVFRNGSIWFVHHVYLPASTPTRSGVDWWQLNPLSMTVEQFSRIEDASGEVFYCYPGIDVNAYGDALINLCVSSANMFASAGYAFHSHLDALNYTQDPYIFKSGAAYYTRYTSGRNRWGDYTFAAHDPVDQSFWSFGEWAKGSTTWSTQIAHLTAVPDTNCNAPVGLTALNIKDTSGTLTWIKTAAYAVSYTIQYRATGSSNWITITTSNTSYNLSGLTANTSYEWKVFTTCQSSTTSNYSSVANFTTVGPCVTNAGFNAPTTLFCAPPASVNFNSTSTNATSYTWLFGDGTIGSGANPSHTYNNYGSYTVQLIATGCTVDTFTAPQFINVDSTISCIVSLPASGIGPTQTGCYGQLFDNGGPASVYINKTESSITIAPTGAGSVSVTFMAFNTEASYDFVYVYDGPNSTYPLLGKYSGTTLPNGGNPITSSNSSITIRMTADDLVNAAGFALSWACAASNVPPLSDFTSDVTQTCNGMVEFTDKSSRGPTSWLWDFGDGQTSAFQNPTHVYSANGTYHVKLRSTNPHGSDSLTKSNYITVNLPPAPVVAPVSPLCSGNSTTISATGTPAITWYDSPEGGSVLGTGSTLNTPPLFGSGTYYVASDQTKPEKTVGPMYTIGNPDFNTSGYFGLKFDAYVPFTLKSVILYARTTGVRTITLKHNGDVIQSLAVNLIGDSQGPDTIVTLNFNVPTGSGLELGITGNNIWRNYTGAVFPYTLPGVLSITGNITPSQPTYYYCFYHWIIQEASCLSARVPVTVQVDNGPTAAFTSAVNFDTVTFNSQSTGAAQYLWNFGDTASGPNNVSTLQSPTHKYNSSGTFKVCLKAQSSNGCWGEEYCEDITVLIVGADQLNDDNHILVYPDPFSDELNVEFKGVSADREWHLSLMDVTGRKVADKNLNGFQTSGKYLWSMPPLSKGVYLLVIYNEDARIVRRITRQ